eukprot:1140072-Pelagomonas_calceolata.AAC.2
MNQADVLGLAEHVLLQLSRPRRQSASGASKFIIVLDRITSWTFGEAHDIHGPPEHGCLQRLQDSVVYRGDMRQISGGIADFLQAGQQTSN